MRRSLLVFLCLISPALAEPRRDRQGDPLPEGAIARFGTIRYRIGSTRILHSFAVSPDCKSLVAEDGRGIIIWDLEKGTPRVHAHIQPSEPADAGPNYDLCYSPDGTKIARLA